MHLSFFALSSSILATNTVAYAAAAAAAAADLQSGRHVLASMPKNYGLAIERRQDIECSSVEPGPQFCERSCGPLFTACVVYNSCYLPSLGQTCCETAEYCPAGTYCSTLGCCINGSSLEDCIADLSSGNTAIGSSVPGTLFATTPATRVVTTPLVATNSLVATTSRLKTSSLIASSNSADPTLSVPSPLSSPTSEAATPSVSTSSNRQTSESISDLPSNTRTTAATLPRTTSSATPASNSGSKNSEDIISLVSGLLGFLLIL